MACFLNLKASLKLQGIQTPAALRVFPFRGQALSLTRIIQPRAELLISTLEWWAEAFYRVWQVSEEGWGISCDTMSRSQKGAFIFYRGSDSWGWWKKLIWAIRKLWYRTAGLWITQQTQCVPNSNVQTGHLRSWNLDFWFLLARAAAH